MLNPSTAKFIAFELAKADIQFYFEAGLMLDAYQIMQSYQIPFSRLQEFWDEQSKKLLRFSNKMDEFLNAKQLRLPNFSLQQKAGQALSRTPLGLFLKLFLSLKSEAELEQISSVFTSNFIDGDLARRHYIDAKLRQSLHAHVTLPIYFNQIEDFTAWREFAAFVLPDHAPMQAWLNYTKNFFNQLKINIPHLVLEQMDAFFFDVDRYLVPMPYDEFLEHFNLFLENSSIEVKDAQFYVTAEVPDYSNSFVPLRLQHEFNIQFIRPEVVPTQLVFDQHKQGTAPYRLPPQRDVLTQPQNLKLREQAGGAAILSQQGACPFKAFGHFQLKLNALVNDEVWLSQKLKGIAIHRVLEKIWDQLKSQKNLLNLSDDELKTLVQDTCINVVFGLSHNLQFFLPHALANLEIERLKKLIYLWLLEEKKRPAFTVNALETQGLAYLGELVIKLRLDRIDELENGERIVIDYKTGSVNIKDWVSEPMSDVQLPLYVLTTSAAGALLAEVNNNLCFTGIVADQIESFSEVKAADQIAAKSWDELKLFWQKNIDALAQDITQGVAHVAPIQGACDYCDLHAVCRVKEMIHD